MAVELVEPVKRVEHYLYALCVMDFNNIPIPRSRLEFFAHALITGVLPEFQAETREEVYITAIVTGDYANLPLPKSRADQLLYKICLGETEIRDIELETRYEMLLAYIAEHSDMSLEKVLVECVKALQTIPNTIETSIVSGTVKGDTLVNVLGEPCYKDSMTNKASQKLVANFDASNATIVDETLKGQTLVNLAKNKNYSKPYSIAEINMPIKANTTYIAFFDLLNVSTNKGGALFVTSQKMCNKIVGSGADDLYNNNVIGGVGREHGINYADKMLKFTSGENETWLHIRTGNSVFNFGYDNMRILEYVEGMENWDIPYFEGTRTFGAPHPVDGEIKSAILSGNSEVVAGKNKCNVEKIETGWLDGSSGEVVSNIGVYIPVKVSGTITISNYIWDVRYVYEYDTNGTYLGRTKVETDIVTLVLKQNTTLIKIGFYQGTIEAVKNTIKNKLQVEQGEIATECEPYNQTLVSVKMPVLTTTGKNLFDSNNLVVKAENTYGYIDFTDYDGELTFSIRDKDTSVDMSGIFFGATYRGCDYDGTISNNGGWLFANGEIARSSLTTSKCKYFSFHPNSNRVLDKIIARYDIQIEESSQPTSYEPFKSNILTVNEDVTLRGIGDVKDELNLMTGELTQCVGEIVLDGSDDESYDTMNTNNSNYLVFRTNTVNRKYSSNWITDWIIGKGGYNNILNTEYEGLSFYASASTPDRVVVKILKSRLSSPDINGFKQWLSQNPITVQYELKTPTIKTVDLIIQDQDNQPQTALHSFTDGCINVQSQGLLPSVDYVVPTDNSYYHVAKPNTLYSIKNGLVDTFTTPSDLKPMLILEGSQAMMIEGTSAKDIPYFTGIKSVQMPVLMTTGKNLFSLDSVLEWHRLYWTVDSSQVGTTKPLQSANGLRSFTIKNIKNHTLTFSKAMTGAFRVYGTYTKPAIGVSATALSVDNTGTSLSFDSKNYEYLVVIYYNYNNAQNIGEEEAKNTIQLEVGSTATPYEPYKSNTLTTPSDLELRGIGDVQDELNVATGELIQRIGEIVLNGTEDYNQWTVGSQIAEGMVGIYTRNKNNIIDTTENGGARILCDKLPIVYRANLRNTTENSVVKGSGYIGIVMKANSVDEVKAWLRENPVTVQYGLATPVIKTVDITIKDQDGNVKDRLSTFNDATHVSINAVDIIPQVDLEVRVDANTMANVALQQNDLAVAQASLSDAIDAQNDDIEMTQNALDEVKGE